MLGHILDLDGSLLPQSELRTRFGLNVLSLQDWGPRIRLGCSFERYRRFEHALSALLGPAVEPAITLYGSGDFHHVSLALLRRLRAPVNLLVLDNHPDWMRGVPFLHCGTWLYHAAKLPQVERIFHVGGNVDFDNFYRWLAPWQQLRSGKIVVLPAVRSFRCGNWAGIDNPPLRTAATIPMSASRLEELLEPHRAELGRRPLYVSLDKDVLIAEDAIVNWDSGQLCLSEVQAILRGFLNAAEARLAGIDILGDWSPVRLEGLGRKLLHWTEHPSLSVDPAEATRCHERTNRVLLETFEAHGPRSTVPLDPPLPEKSGDCP